MDVNPIQSNAALEGSSPVSTETVSPVIIGIVADMVTDWGHDGRELTAETRLVADLGFVSVDIIHLIVAIEQHFARRMTFQKLLMKDNRYVDDLTIASVAEFVAARLRE